MSWHSLSLKCPAKSRTARKKKLGHFLFSDISYQKKQEVGKMPAKSRTFHGYVCSVYAIYTSDPAHF